MAAASSIVRNLGLSLTGDLDVQAGQLALVRDGIAIAQAVGTAIKMVKGEWFLDLDVGLDYLGAIFVKAPNLTIIRAKFLTAILAVAGVLDVPTLKLSFDAAARTLAVTWAVTTDVGELSGTEVIA